MHFYYISLAYYIQVDEIFNNYPRLREYDTDKKSQQLCFGIFTAQALLKYLQCILCLPANIISSVEMIGKILMIEYP